MLRISGTLIDRSVLDAWVTRLGLENEWALAGGDAGSGLGIH
jgi:hypothetical protein